MQGFKDFFDASAHWVFGLGLIIAATVLTSTGVMTLEKWESYTMVIFLGVAGSHAAISIGDSIASRGSATVETALDHPIVKAVLEGMSKSPSDTPPTTSGLPSGTEKV
jgi:hypothetical protein